jgi:hypothetical protein
MPRTKAYCSASLFSFCIRVPHVRWTGNHTALVAALDGMTDKLDDCYFLDRPRAHYD